MIFSAYSKSNWEVVLGAMLGAYFIASGFRYFSKDRKSDQLIVPDKASPKGAN